MKVIVAGWRMASKMMSQENQEQVESTRVLPSVYCFGNSPVDDTQHRWCFSYYEAMNVGRGGGEICSGLPCVIDGEEIAY